MRALFWLLVVVVVLAVGADRIGVRVAERAVAQELQSSQHLQHAPNVHIAGFPFLTQLAQRHYDRVTASTTDVRVGGGDRSVVLSRVGFTFRDVRTDARFTRFEAATGRARATLSYPELSRALGLSVTYAGQGGVRAGTKISIAGQELTPSLTVKPRLLDGAVRLSGSALAGGVPAPAASALEQALGLDVPLTGLPFGIRVTSLTADARGIELRLAGKDLSYRS